MLNDEKQVDFEAKLESNEGVPCVLKILSMELHAESRYLRNKLENNTNEVNLLFEEMKQLK